MIFQILMPVLFLLYSTQVRRGGRKRQEPGGGQRAFCRKGSRFAALMPRISANNEKQGVHGENEAKAKYSAESNLCWLHNPSKINPLFTTMPIGLISMGVNSFTIRNGFIMLPSAPWCSPSRGKIAGIVLCRFLVW